MELITLLKAGIRRQKESIAGVFLLILFVSIALVTAVAVWANSGDHVSGEMARLGYGDLTAWVSGADDIEGLAHEIEALPDVEQVSMQPLIFSGYTIGRAHSDNEGQLLRYEPDRYDYRILTDDLRGYQTIDAIGPGEIYISPALRASFDIGIGEEIRFDLARDGASRTFTVKGYFEDPFMGSSMIDMKSFLVGGEDYDSILGALSEVSDFNILGREGAMLHIFQSEASTLSTPDFNSALSEGTRLGQYTEFSYTQPAIYGFMLILQNIFTGFLLAFAVVLAFVAMVVMGHSISAAIEQEYKDLGILKVMGLTGSRLRLAQMLQYGVGIVGGMVLGLLLTIPTVQLAARLTTTSTGVLMPAGLPLSWCAPILLVALCLLCLFVYGKTARILRIRPIQAIQGTLHQGVARVGFRNAILPRALRLSLAIRQLLSGKKRYIGTCLIAILLVFFASVVGRLDGWLGPNGEGMMNAFSVADHDLGVEPAGEVNMAEIEAIITAYSPIVDAYQLAMQNVTVNGVDYTANIIDEPERFHILQGETCLAEGETVVTTFVAGDLGVDVGDSVTVDSGRRSQTYTIAGIYECANEMGANIGMNREGYAQIADVSGYIWCHHYILGSSVYNEEIMARLQQDYRIELSVHTNSWSGLDGIVGAMRMLTVFMYGIMAVFILVVTALTSSKLLRAEQSDLAILKSVGFTSGDLRLAFTLRFVVVVAIGGIIGVLLSSFFADAILSGLLRSFGIAAFHSTFGFGNSILPALIVTLQFALFAYLSTCKLKKVDIVSLIRYAT